MEANTCYCTRLRYYICICHTPSRHIESMPLEYRTSDIFYTHVKQKSYLLAIKAHYFKYQWLLLICIAANIWLTYASWTRRWRWCSERRWWRWCCARHAWRRWWGRGHASRGRGWRGDAGVDQRRRGCERCCWSKAGLGVVGQTARLHRVFQLHPLSAFTLNL